MLDFYCNSRHCAICNGPDRVSRLERHSIAMQPNRFGTLLFGYTLRIKQEKQAHGSGLAFEILF